MQKTICLLAMFAAIAANMAFSQKNNIHIQTGLFHYFFDKSPILNVNYLDKGNGVFSGLLYNSIGLQYSRALDDENALSVEYMLYNAYYWNVHPNLMTKVVAKRDYNTFNLTYLKTLPLKSNLKFTYGGGINYRHGSESIVVNYGYFAGLNFYESLMEVRTLDDLGVNLRTGINYFPIKWLTLFSEIDLVGFVYLNDKSAIQRLNDVYNYSKYPYRFDLSWRFGIGFNF